MQIMWSLSATAWKCTKTGRMKMVRFSGIKFAAGLAYEVSLRITQPKQLAVEHRVAIASGVRRQATPTTLDADSDSLGQASTARPCLVASGHRHGSICLRLGQATRRIRR